MRWGSGGLKCLRSLGDLLRFGGFVGVYEGEKEFWGVVADEGGVAEGLLTG